MPPNASLVNEPPMASRGLRLMKPAMERDQAIQIRAKALAAVENLVSLLEMVRGTLTPEEFEEVKKGVGLSIGAIEIHLNVPLYQRFPDLEN